MHNLMINKITWNNFNGYTKSVNKTHLLDTVNYFDESYNELLSNKNCFTLHTLNKIYIQSGPLRECRTVHLINSQEQALLTSKLKLCHTFKLLEKLKNIIDINDTKELSRAYVTLLAPNKNIYAHCDTDGKYWSEITRYQFYYTGNSDMTQIIDGNVFPVAPGYLYLFDHTQIHEYHNNSNEDLMLMVFDLKNKGT